MDDRNQYQSLLRGNISAAISKARSTATLTHQGVKGTILELLINDLFKPLLPADFGIGTGQIIDSFGNPPSNQIDIIIYNKAILPPILYDKKVGIFPIESVLYTIEIKTTLTSKELTKANASAKKIHENFEYLQGKSDVNGVSIHQEISKPRAVVFALNTDLKVNGMSEAERYKKTHGEENNYLDAICVAGREYCYVDRECWVSMRNTKDYDEVLNLLSGITNTYRKVSLSRGYPLLGMYVGTDRPGYTLIPCTTLPKLTMFCEQCGNSKEIIPTFNDDDPNIITGTISDGSICKCGGKFKSKRAIYIIKGGRLRDINPTKTE